MANICNFSMRVRGKQKDIDKLITYMTQKYKGKVTDKMHFYGTYNVNFYIDDTNAMPNDYVTASIDGLCRWSGCYTLVHNYLEQVNYINEFDNRVNCEKHTWKPYDIKKNAFHIMTMPDMCKRYGMFCEIRTTEPDMCFSEHFVIDSKGTILIDESCDYYEPYIAENDDAYESLKEYFQKNPNVNNDMVWIDGEKYNGDADSYENLEDSIITVCDFDIYDYSKFDEMINNIKRGN